MTAASSFARENRDLADRHSANRAVAVSAVGLLVTGGIELLLAIVTGSVALLSDALHNLSDVSTSAVVFLGFRISKKPPSARYPYGYERAEDLVGLLIALVIWGSALLAGYQSYRKLVGHTGTSNLTLGMAGAVLGIVGNQVVARYKMRIGKRINSATLVADAKHSWLDALSSVGALLGLILVALGYRWGDPVAGLAVTLFICNVGYEVTKDVTHRLMDGVESHDLDDVSTALGSVPGLDVRQLRGRWLGRSLHIEVGAALPAGLTLGDLAALQRQANEHVLAQVPAVRGVTVLPVE